MSCFRLCARFVLFLFFLLMHSLTALEDPLQKLEFDLGLRVNMNNHLRSHYSTISSEFILPSRQKREVLSQSLGFHASTLVSFKHFLIGPYISSILMCKSFDSDNRYRFLSYGIRIKKYFNRAFIESSLGINSFEEKGDGDDVFNHIFLEDANRNINGGFSYSMGLGFLLHTKLSLLLDYYGYNATKLIKGRHAVTGQINIAKHYRFSFFSMRLACNFN